MKSEKRGLAHTEIIIAFVLFVGFLLAGLYFFNPVGLGTKRLLDSTLFYANDGIIENLSSELTIYSVVINSSVPSGAAVVSIPLNIETGQAVRVEKNNGNSVSSQHSSGHIIFNRENERFFMVKVGEFDAQNPSLTGTALNQNEYSISSSDKREVIVEKKAIGLKNYYDGNYAQLKKDLNLPSRVDFAFSIGIDNSPITAERQIPANVEVLSGSARKEILRSDGKTIFGDLSVRVW